MRWHCRDRDRKKGFFLTLQQRLHLLLYPGDPALTGPPGLPAAWDHCLPAPLQGHVGCQELKQAGGGKRSGPSAIWEKMGLDGPPAQRAGLDWGNWGPLLRGGSSVVPMPGPGSSTHILLPRRALAAFDVQFCHCHMGTGW